MDALIELIWVVVVLGGPMFLAWLWYKRPRHDEAPKITRIPEPTNVRLLQSRKDNHIFEVVEEFRNGTD